MILTLYIYILLFKSILFINIMVDSSFTENELKEIGKNLKLDDTWIFYFHAKNMGKLYNDNTLKLIEVNNVADFWGTYNNIPEPSKMFYDGINSKILKKTGQTPSAISVFRKDIYPAWEDQLNIDGFELSIKRFNDKNIDLLWKDALLFLIGESCEHSDILNGIRVVDCSYGGKVINRVEFWFKDKQYKTYFENVIKKTFNLAQNTKLMYREHSVLKEK